MENFDWDDRLLIIIMEFVPGGDLGKMIAEDIPFNETMVQTMAKQLLSALGYLHANNITHRDVKPDNILINAIEPLEVKLTDFGLSKMVDTEQTFLRTFCGTLLYCAPEVYTEYAEYDDKGIRNRGKRARRVPGQRYNHAVDIWSLGGVLFYSLTGAPPYPVKTGISYSELLHMIMTTMLNVVPLRQYSISQQGIDFISRMLQRRPEHRDSIDELSDHPWLGGSGSTIEASQSYDEITDEEDINIEPSQFRPVAYEEDRVSDSMGEESEKENFSFGQGAHQPRLFGEVGVSAIGSSGVIPSNYLNLPGEPTRGSSEVLDSQVDEAYNSDDSGTTRGKSRRTYRQTSASIVQQQSADQLQSLVEDVASQSLGGSVPRPSNVNHSIYSTRSMDLTSSKRKPHSSFETSDDFDENTPPGKPFIKRLKSEGNIDDLTDEMIEEYKLLARVPQVRRLGSGRQVDRPVHKETYWAPDKKTWHLNYPEMTQLQLDAFSQAAREAGEDFSPGNTRYWNLAMKYFPPTTESTRQGGNTLTAVPGWNGRKADDDTAEFPSTAAPAETDSIPDTLPPEPQIVVPLQFDMASNRAIGMLGSDPNSCIQGISFPITDSLVSFGRKDDNTEVFLPSSEPRVPKYAFKMMMWKEGYDPAKDPSKVPHPWLRESSDDHDSYYFWISTKATLGIKINGYLLASANSKSPFGPSLHWAKIYDGDSLIVWGSDDINNQTRLTFRCFWGGSSKSRGENQHLELANPALAQKLDGSCQRTERRIREGLERRRKLSETKAEHAIREKSAERERERSRAFEQKRREAVDFLAARQSLLSRRASPASMPPTAQASRMQVTRASRLSPEKDASRSAW